MPVGITVVCVFCGGPPYNSYPVIDANYKNWYHLEVGSRGTSKRSTVGKNIVDARQKVKFQREFDWLSQIRLIDEDGVVSKIGKYRVEGAVMIGNQRRIPGLQGLYQGRQHVKIEDILCHDTCLDMAKRLLSKDINLYDLLVNQLDKNTYSFGQAKGINYAPLDKHWGEMTAAWTLYDGIPVEDRWAIANPKGKSAASLKNRARIVKIIEQLGQKPPIKMTREEITKDPQVVASERKWKQHVYAARRRIKSRYSRKKYKKRSQSLKKSRKKSRKIAKKPKKSEKSRKTSRKKLHKK